MIENLVNNDNLTNWQVSAVDVSEPAYVQLYRHLRTSILNGKFVAGDKLPSTREFSMRAGVARITIVKAYEQLLAEGLVETRPGAGTFVSNDLAAIRESVSPETELTSWGKRVVAQRKEVVPFASLQEGVLDFGIGRSFAQDFPYGIWRRLLARYLSTDDAMLSRYGSVAGFLPLREALAEYLSRSRGVACSAEQVFIVSGAQQALDILSRLLLSPGDEVLVETPGYQDAYTLFRLHGAKLIPLAVDEYGLPVDQIPSKSRARMVFVTPAHQFPRGGTMPAGRRLQLLDWAHRSNAMIVEDDYDGDLRYSGRPMAALQSMDWDGRVIYLGTFSKVLFPALRLGYLILPQVLIEPFSWAKELLDRGAPTLTQAAVADFITEGHYERHLRNLRRVYGRKRRVLVDAMTEYLPGDLHYSPVEAGLHIMTYLDEHLDEEYLVSGAAEIGVRVYPGQPYHLERPAPPSILLGFSGLTDDNIREGIQRLSTLWRT